MSARQIKRQLKPRIEQIPIDEDSESSADEVAELSEYKNLENCLENKGYSVVFFFEEEN